MTLLQRNINLEQLRAKLAARERLRVDLPGFRESAVLLPIVVERGQPERLVLTVRRADLPTHPGQISFPGGKRDESDQDAAATAIREASEELGIAPADVEVLGHLDDVPTPTGFVITPVVAAICGPTSFTPSADEVAAVFACELDRLRDPALYHDAGAREFLGVRYVMHEYLWQEHRIWGATARMVHQLLELL